MALDKLVDSTQLDNNLTSVANAIRAKSGGTGQLAFPAGFVSEIGNISGGGGITPTGTKEITITANGTTTEDVTNYAAAQITVNVPPSGGGVLSGTVTPSERTTSVSFEVGDATVNHVLIFPKSETPMKSGGKTVGGILYNADLFWPYMVLQSNNAGASLTAPSVSLGGKPLSELVEKSGTTLTVSVPSSATGYFETIEYAWFAW